MINKVTGSCSACSEFFITKNPEILVVAGAIIAALGVVLYQNGIGTFSQMVGVGASGLFLFGVFAIATINKYFLQEAPKVVVQLPQKETEPTAVETQKAPPKKAPQKPKRAAFKRQSPAPLEKTLSFGAMARINQMPRETMVAAMAKLKRNEFLKAADGSFEALKKAAPKTKADWLQSDENGMTVLHIAASSKFAAADKVAFIIAESKTYGALTELINAKDADDMIPLHHAACPQVVVALIQAGAEKETTDCNGRTPLLAMIPKQTKECVVALLTFGVNILACDENKRNALMMALLHNKLDLIEHVVISAAGEKSKLLEACDREGNQALHYAASYGDRSSLEFLLSQGAVATNTAVDSYQEIVRKRWNASKEALGRGPYNLTDMAFKNLDAFMDGFATDRMDDVCAESIIACELFQSVFHNANSKTL